jgi:hypothetical protein
MDVEVHDFLISAELELRVKLGIEYIDGSAADSSRIR